MYFCAITADGRPTCLCAGTRGNFVIAEMGKGTGIYEVLKNPMSNADAHDICTQEDTELAKMMFEMQVSKNNGHKGFVSGTMSEVLMSLENTHEAEQAFRLVKEVYHEPGGKIHKSKS